MRRAVLEKDIIPHAIEEGTNRPIMALAERLQDRWILQKADEQRLAWLDCVLCFFFQKNPFRKVPKY